MIRVYQLDRENNGNQSNTIFIVKYSCEKATDKIWNIGSHLIRNRTIGVTTYIGPLTLVR